MVMGAASTARVPDPRQPPPPPQPQVRTTNHLLFLPLFALTLSLGHTPLLEPRYSVQCFGLVVKIV